MTAHTAVVFTRYMMLSLESRESNDSRSLGELFLYFSDEMSDITWIQAFQMLLQMFRTMLSDNTELSETEPLPAKAGRFGLLLKQPKVVATSLISLST